MFKGPWWTIYSSYCIFDLYCIVLHFNVSFANALHLLYLVWCIRPKCPRQFLLPCNSYWNFYRLLCKSMIPTVFLKMFVKLKHIYLASYVEVENPYDKHTSWEKSPWNYVNVHLEYLSNSMDLELGNMCKPCNSFLAKVRESKGTWVQKSQGESENFAKKLGWIPEGVTHNFAEFTVVKSRFLRLNWQI